MFGMALKIVSANLLLLFFTSANAGVVYNKTQCDFMKGTSPKYWQENVAKGLCAGETEHEKKHAKKVSKKLTTQQCQTMGLTPKATGVCRNLSWGMWNQIPMSLQQVLCVNYSGSMCFKGKDLDDVVTLFAEYPDYLSVAIEKYTNDPMLMKRRNAKEMIAKLKEFADDNDIDIDAQVKLAPVKVEGYEFVRDNCNGASKGFCEALTKKQWNGMIPYFQIFKENVNSAEQKQAVTSVFAENEWLVKQYYRAYKQNKSGPNAIAMKVIIEELESSKGLRQNQVDKVIKAANEYIAYLEDQKERKAKLYADAKEVTSKTCGSDVYKSGIKQLSKADQDMQMRRYMQSAIGYELYLSSMQVVASLGQDCSKPARYHLYLNKNYAIDKAQEGYIRSNNSGKPIQNLIRVDNKVNAEVSVLKREYGID